MLGYRDGFIVLLDTTEDEQRGLEGTVTNNGNKVPF